MAILNPQNLVTGLAGDMTLESLRFKYGEHLGGPNLISEAPDRALQLEQKRRSRG